MTDATISFVTSSKGSKILITQDADRNIDEYGKTKTSFAYGETAYFRVYAEHPDKLAVFASDGTLTPMGICTEDVEDETVVFLDSSSADTDKPVTSVSSYEWMGGSLGAVTRKGTYSVQCEVEPKPSQGLFSAALIGYRTAYALYGITLTTKDRDSYPVIVYAEVVNG
ncbi:hypothetical protein [Seleniivibrio sp.]|uniref:hypothetical protein n=1 Tax=Seleniivibrio sp. TaxID=2898801 RepID=UPI0025F5F8C9|nr:hypothetical protein [Seleniivibrio sp.]MCD8552335.1 hypothetical protein [Seleniivibrio sp.]